LVVRWLLLLAALVLAIAVPTALVQSTRAARPKPVAQPGVYSVQQLLRVFRAQGIRLTRQPVAATWGYEEFASADSGVSVNVYSTVPRTRILAYAYDTSGGSPPTPPKIATRGNLSVVWPRRDNAAVRGALARLEYSRADALRAPPPTFVLRPGHERTISSASNDEVDCVAGSSDESETPADLAGVDSGSYSDGGATLRFSRPTSSTIAFVCL
jgi:hypothetical protein